MEHNAASPVKNSELVEALGDWAGVPPHVRLRAASAAASLSAVSGITSDQLLATKQFRPYEDAVAAARGDAAPVTGTLLSAPEKIRELTKLLENSRTERERLSREVEDVQAEKVSMEYLLREKLEKLVQSEIESRLAAYQRDGVALSGSSDGSATAAGAAAGMSSGSGAYASMIAASNRQLQSEVAARTEELAAARAQHVTLEEEIRSLRRRLQQSQAGVASGSAGGSSEAAVSAAIATAAAAAAAEGRDPATVQQLRDRLSVHAKERRAIHTIMEQKIKTLVDAIAAAAASVQQPLSSSSGPHPGGQLSREVQALQRLVNASIAALRNSELEQQQQYDSGVASSPATVSSAPLSRATERGNMSAAVAAPTSAPTPASGLVSVDAMIQRRKDELARMRGASSEASSSAFHGGVVHGTASAASRHAPPVHNGR